MDGDALDGAREVGALVRRVPRGRPRLQAPDGGWQCLVVGCQRKFLKRYRLTRHLKDHQARATGALDHRFPGCGKKVACTDALAAHVGATHASTTPRQDAVVAAGQLESALAAAAGLELIQ